MISYRLKAIRSPLAAFSHRTLLLLWLLPGWRLPTLATPHLVHRDAARARLIAASGEEDLFGPPPIAPPQIPSAFFGCWDGQAEKPAKTATAADPVPLTGLGRVRLCYEPLTLEIKDFDLQPATHHRLLHRVLEFMRLRSHHTRIKNAATTISRITPTQVYSHSKLTLEFTESSIFELPHSQDEEVVDDQVATLADAGAILVDGRLSLPDSVMRTWHARLLQW